jgi:uncharacterized protein
MTEVEAVTFRNDRGQRLFGTLHSPASARADAPAVILMSPGVKMRVGPGRLYLPITDLFTRRGHTVLRFDFFGLGDSEGDLEETVLADVYSHIEAGRYAADATAALQWMKEERGHSRFIVGGLCGGAITALHAAHHDPAVEALLSIGMTVTLASDAVRPAAQLSAAELTHRRRGYLRRMLKPHSWWRLLTLQSEVGVIIRSLFVRTRPPEKQNAPPDASALTPEQLGTINPMFPRAFFDFLERGGHALMVFSERDRLFTDYQEKFVALHRNRLEAHAARVTQHLVLGANHVLSHREWQEDMLAATDRWLTGLAHD